MIAFAASAAPAVAHLLQPNGGVASALNHGLAATDADRVGILDDGFVLPMRAIGITAVERDAE
ncbi:MAG: hypothetical protein ACREPY_09350 [Rhodanobacteraceae bacterium]